MMLPTHALAGMLLALGVAAVAPEHARVALVAGLAGGVLPDLDMYAGHRRTLHYPVYYPLAGAAAAMVAFAVPTTVTVGLAVALLAAALHSVSDVLGGGLELRPWEGTSDRAVYDHHRGRWLPPRRVVAYDGSPGDLALALLVAAPLLAVLDGPLEWVVLAALAVGAVYASVRRVLPTLAEVLVEEVATAVVPERALVRVPDRYRPDGNR